MDNEGIPRHGIYTALWNRHQTGNNHVIGTALCDQYLCLLSHVLVAAMSAAGKHSSLNEYENYAGPKEFQRKPIRNYQLSLTLRDLSLSEFSSLVTQLNPVADFHAFLKHVQQLAESRPSIPGVSGEASEKYISSISSYLSAVMKEIQTGQLVNRKDREAGDHTGSNASRKTHHGFVNVGTHFYRRTLSVADFCLDDGVGKVEVVYTKGNESEIDRIHSGESPDEDDRPVIALYNPQEFKGAMARARYAERIKVTAAQRFPWDFNLLTDTEISRLQNKFDDLWLRFLNEKFPKKKDASVAQENAQAALIIETMLWLGQSAESARNLLIRDSTTATIAELALLISTAHDGTKFVHGWRMPALRPNYAKHQLPSEQNAMNREMVDCFVIPDISGLGLKILTYLSKISRHDDRVFSAEKQTADQYFKKIISGIVDGERITPGRVSRVIGNEITRVSGDQTLMWCATGDLTRSKQPRMYYTVYNAEYLATIYSNAISALRARTGRADKPPTLVPSNNGNIGARFVVTNDALRACVVKLKQELSEDVFLLNSRQKRIVYHNTYTLYTWLMQALCSTLRAVNNPTEIIVQSDNNQLTASLADKEGIHRDRARPVFLSNQLLLQLNHYQKHRKFIVNSSGLQTGIKELTGDANLLFYLDDETRPRMLTRSWIEAQLKKIGHPLPGNFHRAYLRTELLHSHCPSQVIDAFLGHANQGESPFDSFSSFDYGHFTDTLSKHLPLILRKIGIEPRESTLCPH